MNRLMGLGVLVLALAALATSCINRSKKVVFTKEVYTPLHAEGFFISKPDSGASSVLTITRPWQGSGTEQQIFLSRNGEPSPEGFDGQTVKLPVQRVVCMSSSHVATLSAIGKEHLIKGVSGADFLSNQSVREAYKAGEIKEVGYDSNFNFEMIASIKPDVVLIYGIFGDNTQLSSKLRELGIPYIYIGEYIEHSPLGKAEWMVALGEITDCRHNSQEIFNDIAHKYDSLKLVAANTTKGSRPKVMLNTPYRDSWFMPGGENYMVRLINDAGAEYIHTEGKGTDTAPISLEEAYLLASKSDFWLNVGPVNDVETLLEQNPKFTQVKPVLDGRVYNNNARQTPGGGSDFWESGVVMPHVVLEDLISIFNSESDSLYFYKQLK